MYRSLPSPGSRPAQIIAVAAAMFCCCTLPSRGGIAAREHVVTADNSAVTLPAPQTSAPLASTHFDSRGNLISSAIVSSDSSPADADAWLMFWQSDAAQPTVQQNNEVTTKLMTTDSVTKPDPSTPLPIPVPNAFNAGTVGFVMLGLIMFLRRSRRWLT